MDNEIWRDIENYEGLYQVSNFGRVKSFHKGGRILKSGLNFYGYLRVQLFHGGKDKSVYVHRLVAEAFIPNPDSKPEVNHINGIKDDNRASNLEWVTRSENAQHALRTGLRRQGGEHPDAKLTAAQVVYVRDNPDNLTGAELAEKLGVTATAVSYVQSGKSYKNAGSHVRKAKPHKYTPRVPDEVREQICREYIPNVRGHGVRVLAQKFGIDQKTIRSIIREGRPDCEIIPFRLPDEVRAEIRRLYVRGSREFGSHALAERFGVTHGTILNIIHQK